MAKTVVLTTRVTEATARDLDARRGDLSRSAALVAAIAAWVASQPEPVLTLAAGPPAKAAAPARPAPRPSASPAPLP